MKPAEQHAEDLMQRMVGAWIDLMASPLGKRLVDLTHQYHEAKRQLDKQGITGERAAMGATKEE